MLFVLFIIKPNNNLLTAIINHSFMFYTKTV